MHAVYLYELKMYLAKVEAEAIERELKEALKQQEELEKKTKRKAKSQQESLQGWPYKIQVNGKFGVRQSSKSKRRKHRLRPPTTTSHSQTQSS